MIFMPSGRKKQFIAEELSARSTYPGRSGHKLYCHIGYMRYKSISRLGTTTGGIVTALLVLAVF